MITGSYLLMMLVWTTGTLPVSLSASQVAKVNTFESCTALVGEMQAHISDIKTKNPHLKDVHYAFWCHQDRAVP